MSKIPCKKCPGCGLYHCISVMHCYKCGRELQNVPALLVEINDIPGELFGEIDENAIAYVQQCSACGTLNFSSSIDEPVNVCYNCHKKRVASVVPSEYLVDGIPSVGLEDDATEDDSDRGTNKQKDKSKAQSAVTINKDEDDDDSAQWQGILGNIRQAVRLESLKETTSTSESSTERKCETLSNESDDEEDEDDADWAGVLGGKCNRKRTRPVETKREITLTALGHEEVFFTIEAKENRPYMLGRSENQSSFLASDGRVGNEHCYLFFKDGFWYVKDNHSANGTAVNSKDIGLNGVHIVNDGDELKLGHHPDSVAFRISI